MNSKELSAKKTAYQNGYWLGYKNPESSTVDNPYDIDEPEFVDFELGFIRGSTFALREAK